MHLTKDSNRAAAHRVMNSVAFVAAPRAVFGVGRDPQDEDRRVVVPIKFNIGPTPPTLAFRITKKGRIQWESAPVQGMSAQAVLGVPTAPSDGGEDQSERERAKEFLTEILKNGQVAALVTVR